MSAALIVLGFAALYFLSVVLLQPPAKSLEELARDFMWESESWEYFQDLKGSNSLDVPVEFMALGHAVEAKYGAPPKEDE